MSPGRRVLGLALVLGLTAGGLRLSHAMVLLARPLTPARVLIGVSAFLVLLALVLAVLQGAAGAEYAAFERRLRTSLPSDLVSPYEGPEGRGLRFEGAHGTLLLLQPAGGLGRPVLLERPDTPPFPPAGPLPPPHP